MVKKLVNSLKLMLFISILLVLYSCYKEQIKMNKPLQESNSTYLEGVKDVSVKSEDYGKIAFGKGIIVIDIARKKYDCKERIGICKICFFCDTSQPPSDEKIIEDVNEAIEDAIKNTNKSLRVPIIEEYNESLGKYMSYILIEFTEKVNFDDTNLYIDENIFDVEAGYYLEEGIYGVNIEIG